MKTLILVQVETPREEQGEYVRKEAERLLENFLREKHYVVGVRAWTLSDGTVAGALAAEVVGLRLMLR